MHNRTVILATASALTVMVALVARGQAIVDTTRHVADSAAVQPKKGGMFSKMKGLAQNKTAQNIAKAAVCTAIPGGQYVVGAIDAKQNKSVGAAATSAATAAAGAGVGCIPGMGGVAGMGLAPKMPGGGITGVAGIASAAKGRAGGMSAVTSALPGMAAGMTAPQAASLANAQTMAAMSGMSAAQIAAMQKAMASQGVAPAGMTPQQAVALANAQAQAAQMQGAQMQAAQMQAMSAQAAQMQAMSAQAQLANTGAQMQSEAAGQQVKLSGDAASELAKGKLVIRQVDWVQHSPMPSEASANAFADVMAHIGTAMKQSGATYHVDIYVDKHYPDAEAPTLAAQRMAIVIAMLQGDSPTPAIQAGKMEKDAEQRIEIVKVK
jgi:hypothetical protein